MHKVPTEESTKHPSLLITTNMPLADKNWFGTGGPARFYCEPQTAQQFQEAILYANASQLDIFILGQGANILISDDGFDVLVIRPMLTAITILSNHGMTALIKGDA